MNDLTKKINFLNEIEAFKTLFRFGYLENEVDHESDADHTWHMCMFALCLQDDLGFEHADIAHTIKIILIHDLVEIYAGDVFAYAQSTTESKNAKRASELAGANKLFGLLPEGLSTSFMDLREEYEDQETLESHFAKTIDKLQGLAQNTLAKGKIRQEKNITESMSRHHNEKVMKISDKVRNVFEQYYKKAADENLFPE